jgi:aminocarboxymuconate-semialdehyde decarboxylase
VRDPRPLKIDIHTHILPQDWPDLRDRYGYGGWVKMEHEEGWGTGWGSGDPGSGTGCRARMMIDGQLFREVEASCWDPATRLRDCESAGVRVQVLSTVPVMFSYWARPRDTLDLAQRLNDHIAGVCAAHPQRFIGLGTLPMQSPELAVPELERCMGELGLAGIEIGTHIDGWNLYEPQVVAVLEAAAALGAAVFVHPWDMMGAEEMPRYWMPWLVGMPAEVCRAICAVIFGGVLERLPGLRIAFAHGGGSFPGTIGRIEQGHRVRPDLCAVDNDTNPRAYLGRFYVDSLVHDAEALDLLMRLIGAERIALGSDYPFPLGEDVPGRLIESLATLSEGTRARLLAGTALEFLNVDPARFGLPAAEAAQRAGGRG